MSAELYSASGNNASLQGTTEGDSKPLHRLIKGQPKIIGIVMLVLGSSFLIISISIYSQHIWTILPPGLLMGILFIICGILYILTEHYPTKKTVTVSLALSIVSILASCWTLRFILSKLVHSHYYRHSDIPEDATTESDEAAWQSYYEVMVVTLEAIFMFYSLVGAIICIVMSTLVGAALHSTKRQVIVVMTTPPTETPAE